MASGNEAEKTDFNHFDVTPLAADHHFLSTRKCFNDKNGAVYSHIMKEWRILQKNLPEGIYVQAYETRIDLLRAVVIGPAGTPYHDGLFFFDIALPSDYPNKPPKVYYHSHGYRLNPNLYANGYVCLSLINTWKGSKNEKWSGNSTLLQVLVSVQGLVLNGRPFFNEPANKKFEGGKERKWFNASVDYNETAFLLSCKTMLQVMKKPPVNYERFVVQHFRGRGKAILGAIEMYEKGCMMVGQLETSNPSSIRVSSKFKKSLGRIKSEVRNAIASLSLALEPDKAVTRTSPVAKTSETATKVGCWYRVIGFAKKIYGN